MLIPTLGSLFLSLASPGLPDGKSAEPEKAVLSFNRDVRPILSDRCFHCHGPDEGSRESGLRLDDESVFDFEHEGKRALVPGEPESSELVRRIRSSDPAVHMPPPESGLSLTDEERAILEQWVLQGAEYEPHWAFVAPQKPRLPRESSWSRTPIDRFIEEKLTEEGLTPSPQADPATLLRRLHLDLTGLPPTPEEIDRFEQELAADPAAYDRTVDRLLASEAHAERMAQVWLDAARYADTNGFHHDNVRTIWPWRDWVLRAFHENKPYDEFVIEQLAGDLLPEASEQDRIATAFARMHNINDEGGALDEEYRVEAVADRIETVATVFMGLTFTCARCHDHKYDPFTQEDYYSLYSFFNSVDERGVYGNNFEDARAYPARLSYITEELQKQIEEAQAESAQALEAREAAAPEVAREQAAWEGALHKLHGLAWTSPEVVSASSQAGLELAVQADRSVLVQGETPGKDTHEIVLRTESSSLGLLRLEALPDPSLPEQSVGLSSNGNAVLSHIEVEVRSLTEPEESLPVKWSWAWASNEQRNGDFDIHNALRDDALGWALGGHLSKEPRTALLVPRSPFGFAGGSELRVKLHYQSQYPQHLVGRVRIDVAESQGDLRPHFPVVTRDLFQSGPHTAASFDEAFDQAVGPENIALLDIRERFADQPWRHLANYKDGEVLRLSGGNSAFYLARSLFTPIERPLDLSLGSDDGLRVFLNGEEIHTNKVYRGAAPDQDRVSLELPAGESVLVFKVVNGGGPGGFYYSASDATGGLPPLLPLALLPAESLDEERLADYQGQWRSLRSPTYRRLESSWRKAEDRVKSLRDQAVPVLIMQELDEPTPTYVLERGSYQLPNEERPVGRTTPAALPVSWPAASPRNRLGFAQWLVRGDHPLTARVHVNRLWQMIFGTGLVATSENFGMQADWPSHPELLDWLAVHFVDLGWDGRALLREIVTSSVYRQRARRTVAAAEIDPGNRLLSHFPRQRLAGEFVRDLALHISGLLVPQFGGPSVKPYQPEGLWREVSIGGSSNTGRFTRDDGEALYRRSIYTFWKRTSPTPQMTVFDAPTREFCVVRRGTTNTPLQALVLWNDEQFVEAARVLATKVLRREDFADDGERLVYLFRTCTGRRPDANEQQVLEDLLQDLTARFDAQPEDAGSLLGIGETMASEELPNERLAAWTLVANSLLSLDETLVRD